jgi:hypothetical protein
MKSGVVHSEFVLDDNTEFTKFHVNSDRFGSIRFCDDCEFNSIELNGVLFDPKNSVEFNPISHLNSPEFT